MNAVPANKGTEPKASWSSKSSSGVIADASLTKARWGLQEVPNINSNMFIVEKNFRLSNNRDTIIPTVVKIATKEEVNNKTFSIISTSSLALLLFWIFLYAKVREPINAAVIITTFEFWAIILIEEYFIEAALISFVISPEKFPLKNDNVCS